jgi:hypothetical protein
MLPKAEISGQFISNERRQRTSVSEKLSDISRRSTLALLWLIRGEQTKKGRRKTELVHAHTRARIPMGFAPLLCWEHRTSFFAEASNDRSNVQH